ncbi:MAG: MerR family DNA-binding transcriptional regulator [Lautropia sp.]
MTTYGISDLAREFGVTARAIRFYEDEGLLAPVRTGAGNRQRRYSARDRTRLSLVLRGKRLGLTLAEVRELLDMYETPADTAPQLERFLRVLDARRETLQAQLADLRATIREIDEQRVRIAAMLQSREAAAA